MGNKRFVYRVSNLVITISVVVILVLLNVFVRDASWKFDFTQSKEFTLTKETKNYIKTIDREIKIYILDSSQDLPYKSLIEREKKIINLYKKVNSKIKVEIVDADKNPSVIRKYREKDRTIDPGSVIVDDGNNWEVISIWPMFKADRSGNEVVEVESKLTNTINKIYLGKMSTVYVLGGHGEITGNDQVLAFVKPYLNDIAYDLKELNLIAEEKVPEDASSLVIAGPIKDITVKEKEAIEEYLKSGGGVMIAISPSVVERETYTNIGELLKKYNLSLDDNIVCEGKGYYKGVPACIFPKLVKSELTQNIYNNGMNIFMPGARSISRIDEKDKDISIIPILRTSEESWGDVNFDTTELIKDETDKKGPLNVAVIAARKEDGEDIYSKVMVYGNDKFFIPTELDMSGGGLLVFTESIKWLDSDKAEIVNVQPKVVKVTTYKTSEKNSQKLKIAACSIPAIFAIASVVVFIKRKD